jgi:hypothetical protein
MTWTFPRKIWFILLKSTIMPEESVRGIESEHWRNGQGFTWDLTFLSAMCPVQGSKVTRDYFNLCVLCVFAVLVQLFLLVLSFSKVCLPCVLDEGQAVDLVSSLVYLVEPCIPHGLFHGMAVKIAVVSHQLHGLVAYRE